MFVQPNVAPFLLSLSVGWAVLDMRDPTRYVNLCKISKTVDGFSLSSKKTIFFCLLYKINFTEIQKIFSFYCLQADPANWKCQHLKFINVHYDPMILKSILECFGEREVRKKLSLLMDWVHKALQAPPPPPSS